MPKLDKTYTVYDPKTYEYTGVPVETFHAARLNISTDSMLYFRDIENNIIAVHHLAPGHSIIATDADGNEARL